jgi:hypothetical protein
MTHINQHAEYIICAEGGLSDTLDQEIVDWFGTVKIADSIDGGGEMTTTLSGLVTDQAGLVGLIRHLHTLGIVILYVQRKSTKPQQQFLEDRLATASHGD